MTAPTPKLTPKQVRRRQRVQAAEAVTGTGAGVAGSAWGGTKLRNTYLEEHPDNPAKLRRATTHVGMKAIERGAKPEHVARVVHALEEGKPPTRLLLAGAALGATATGMKHAQQIEDYAQQRRQMLRKSEPRRVGPPVRLAVPKRGPRHAVKPYVGAHRTETLTDKIRVAYHGNAMRHGPKVLRALDAVAEMVKGEEFPSWAHLPGHGRVRVEYYHGNGHFMVRKSNGEARLAHRDKLNFIPDRPRGSAVSKSAFGVEMIAKADKKKTKYAAAGYAGAAAGGHAGARIGARSAGMKYKDVMGLAREAGAMHGERVGEQMSRAETPEQMTRTAVKGIRDSAKVVRNVPGGARLMRGNKIGSAAGLVAGAGAYGAYRHNKRQPVQKDAFGVEIIDKADRKAESWVRGRDPKTGKTPSGGRYATAYLAGPIHGAVAGKKGKKLRAAGTQLAGPLAGAAAGEAAGAVLTRGRSLKAGATPLGVAGGVGGSILATNRNQAKGRYKRES